MRLNKTEPPTYYGTKTRIDNIDWLFPDDHLLDNTPRIIEKPDDWVSKVMGGVHHIRRGSSWRDAGRELETGPGDLHPDEGSERNFKMVRSTPNATGLWSWGTSRRTVCETWDTYIRLTT